MREVDESTTVVSEHVLVRSEMSRIKEMRQTLCIQCQKSTESWCLTILLINFLWRMRLIVDSSKAEGVAGGGQC